MLLPPGDAVRLGRSLATRMRELLDRQQYEVVIQVRKGRQTCDVGSCEVPLVCCCMCSCGA
jgi:translation elongation factor EF-4